MHKISFDHTDQKVHELFALTRRQWRKEFCVGCIDGRSQGRVKLFAAGGETEEP